MRQRRGWLLIVGVVLILALGPIGFAAWVGQTPPGWLPTPLVHFAFDVRLATAPLAKKLISLSRGSPLEKRVYLGGTGDDARFTSGSVQLTGGLYRSGDDHTALPGILLLHGSTPEGRRMALYRIMAESLAERGYVVLAIDQRGYGRSPAAPDPRREDAYDFVGDAVRALAYLAAQPGVDSTRLNVIGHSFGVGTALTAALMEPRARGIVIIAPGAPDPPGATAAAAERDARARPRGHSYMSRRAFRYGSTVWVRGVDYIGQPIPLEAHAAGALSDPTHKPLLIISDAFEPAGTHAALDAWQQNLRGPSRLLIAPRADHYLNTAGWGPIVVYDVGAVAGVIDEIDHWLGGSPAGCAAEGACAWPGVPLLAILVSFFLGFALLVALVLWLRQRAALRDA